MLPGAIHHPCLLAKSLFLPHDSSQGTTNMWVCAQPQLTPSSHDWRYPAFIILNFSYPQIQLSPLLTNQHFSKYFQQTYICYTWKTAFFPPPLPWKTQRPSFLSHKQQFHQLYSVFHRCKSLLPWPGSTNSSILLKDVVMFFPIRKKH